jgi:hypothetical protein
MAAKHKAPARIDQRGFFMIIADSPGAAWEQNV